MHQSVQSNYERQSIENLLKKELFLNFDMCYIHIQEVDWMSGTRNENSTALEQQMYSMLQDMYASLQKNNASLQELIAQKMRKLPD